MFSVAVMSEEGATLSPSSASTHPPSQQPVSRVGYAAVWRLRKLVIETAGEPEDEQGARGEDDEAAARLGREVSARPEPSRCEMVKRGCWRAVRWPAREPGVPTICFIVVVGTGFPEARAKVRRLL